VAFSATSSVSEALNEMGKEVLSDYKLSSWSAMLAIKRGKYSGTRIGELPCVGRINEGN
jgi:hypothetical protein